MVVSALLLSNFPDHCTPQKNVLLSFIAAFVSLNAVFLLTRSPTQDKRPWYQVHLEGQGFVSITDPLLLYTVMNFCGSDPSINPKLIRSNVCSGPSVIIHSIVTLLPTCHDVFEVIITEPANAPKTIYKV